MRRSPVQPGTGRTHSAGDLRRRDIRWERGRGRSKRGECGEESGGHHSSGRQAMSVGLGSGRVIYHRPAPLAFKTREQMTPSVESEVSSIDVGRSGDDVGAGSRLPGGVHLCVGGSQMCGAAWRECLPVSSITNLATARETNGSCMTATPGATELGRRRVGLRRPESKRECCGGPGCHDTGGACPIDVLELQGRRVTGP
jgi:hypothetical protein